MADVLDFSEERFLRIINGAMKMFVVEYSVCENTTSIRTLEKVLRDNYKKICNGVSKDYLPVGVFKSREEADRFELHFYTFVVPQAQLMSKTQRWRHVSECFAGELDALLTRVEAVENKTGESSARLDNKTENSGEK
jgi:hypothetical protein